MLRIALSLRPAPLLHFRLAAYSALKYAQRRHVHDITAVTALEESPIIQAVKKRMQQRVEVQSHISENMNTPEDKANLKKLAETESLSQAWEQWKNTRQLLQETVPLLEDSDSTMRSLASDEYGELLGKLTGMAETDFPALLVPPSETAHLSAMIEIKAGVGGSEAMLFAADVMRMYMRLASSMGWRATIIANNETENGGSKDAMVEVKGDQAYDMLRWESGVHRVQRVPATEANGRVHTSTIAVLVLPLAEDNGESESESQLFTMDEIKLEVMRSRGAGGQHVNKTESAVRVTHLPTGISVSMQDERSQHQNRRRAFQVLQARLMDRKLTQEAIERRSVRRNLVRSADRSEKIRTYNYAQDRVTDHRLGLSLMNLASVMEGDGLREFIDELAKKHQADLLEEACETLHTLLTLRFFVIFPAFLRIMFEDGEDTPLPPGSPPTVKYEGPWFATQLTLSCTIGILSFLIFSYCRTRYPLLFAPRTKLKAFSPHEAHAHQAFFGWILPTIRVSEYAVLQIVGLDAAVLLNFYKMSFTIFSICSIFAVTILMPINLKHNIDIGDGRDDSDDSDARLAPDTPPERDWFDLISDANSYLSLHLLFTYLFTGLALYFIFRNYKKFIRARQLFSLELVHSIAPRTVMVTRLPPHLRGERALAEYFENMSLSVESVSICREVDSLKQFLDRRTAALFKLESAWVKYLGNPSRAEPVDSDTQPLVDLETGSSDEQRRLVVPNQKRPTLRPGLFKGKVDALEYLDAKFKEADEAVTKRRRAGKFKATHVAFVTFEKMSSAQIAVQAAHAQQPGECVTYQAPEPRDIIWSNMGLTPRAILCREGFVLAAMCLLLFFWMIPVTALAGLLSYKEIKKTWPALARLIDSNDPIRAIVQNSLPSVAMITLNACLPFLLEGLTYVQGYRARSWIEYSLLKKYFLFLLVNVVFIFLFASTYWQLVRDLANAPMKIPEKLAAALQQGHASSDISSCHYAELNAPPMINYGVVYPQGILIFVITLVYSVVQPLIVIFGAIYFGTAYVVYKYKLLFVFYKPYESQGQAWPITFSRLILGIVIYLIFMSGNFVLKKAYILSSLLAPLLVIVVLWAWYTHKLFRPLSKYVSLSSVFEVQRGEDTADVLRLRTGHPVTWSQSYLNHRRYAQNDETLYVAPEDDRTDYSQPPMANWYTGVLNTGKRRYGHPALNGVLPQPWLPIKKDQTIRNGSQQPANGSNTDSTPAVVLTLRKRRSVIRPVPPQSGSSPSNGAGHDSIEPVSENIVTGNPWQDAADNNRPEVRSPQVQHRLSFDQPSGVIMLPDEEWLNEESDSDEEYQGPGHSSEVTQHRQESDAHGEENASKRYATYYHHPERRKRA
ncbi:hypothetical protein NM688_g26 [Phlebia brevispora]|uniref:Uncharacterized protein n=1 Tax=Phlebia brevispora TaxID=194682 RepID=A0ACC1TF74_9APHY|nr:hypothetical protein NM688_g26 [Phlebia brevispora]